jgi:WD repeat and SOF domain-containing protein 1
VVEVWDHNRSEPLHSFKWGHDATLSVRFNPAEAEVLASTGRDRSVGLYDLRRGTPLTKVVLGAYCSSMAWNPR